MNYEDMSDFEINGYVSMYMHGFSWIEFVDGCVSSVKCGNEGSPGFAMVEVCDYCNNPSDAWPIIVENNISMRPMYIRDADGRKLVEWEAIHVERDFPRESFGWDDKNPLRAAMIVFLMMQEAKRG